MATSILEILQQVNLNVDGPKLSGSVQVFTVKAADRFAAKDTVEQLLKTTGTPFQQGVKSSSSIDLRTTDFTIGQVSYRIFYKPARASGAGSRVTDIGESFQCWALSARQKKGSKLVSGDEGVDLVDRTHVTAKVDIKEIKKEATPEWIASGVGIANKFFEKEGLIGNYEFHHDSPMMNAISSHFNKVKKLAGVNININKWNPADIWVVKAGQPAEIIKEVRNTKTLSELNHYIEKQFTSKRLIGVSLKKAPIENMIKRKVVNLGEGAVSDVKFVNLRNHTIDKVTTKDCYIDFTNGSAKGSIQFREFSGKDHQGEIKGTNANNGKVGGGNYIMLLKRALGDRLPSYFLDLKNKTKLYSGGKPAMVNNFIENVVRANKGSAGKLSPKETETLLTNIQKIKTQDWHSCYFSMQLAAVVNTMTVKQKDDFMYNLIAFASSALPGISSVYVKYSAE